MLGHHFFEMVESFLGYFFTATLKFAFYALYAITALGKPPFMVFPIFVLEILVCIAHK
jgi:hypothetical protein